MNKILFVCHGNICRSTMAEFILKDLVKKAGREDEFLIASAATSREEIGNDMHYGTKNILKEKNIPFTKRGAVQITKEDYKNYDLIVIMDENNKRNIKRIIGEDKDNKIVKALELVNESRDVKDPWYTGNFHETYDDLIRTCNAILEKY